MDQQAVFGWLSALGVVLITALGWYTTWREKNREQTVKDRAALREQEIADHEAFKNDLREELSKANGTIQRLHQALHREKAAREQLETREDTIHAHYLEMLRLANGQFAAEYESGEHPTHGRDDAVRAHAAESADNVVRVPAIVHPPVHAH